MNLYRGIGRHQLKAGSSLVFYTIFLEKKLPFPLVVDEILQVFKELNLNATPTPPPQPKAVTKEELKEALMALLQ